MFVGKDTGLFLKYSRDFFLDWCLAMKTKARLCCRFVERRAGTKFSAERILNFTLWVPLSYCGEGSPLSCSCQPTCSRRPAELLVQLHHFSAAHEESGSLSQPVLHGQHAERFLTHSQSQSVHLPHKRLGPGRSVPSPIF